MKIKHLSLIVLAGLILTGCDETDSLHNAKQTAVFHCGHKSPDDNDTFIFSQGVDDHGGYFKQGTGVYRFITMLSNDTAEYDSKSFGKLYVETINSQLTIISEAGNNDWVNKDYCAKY